MGIKVMHLPINYGDVLQDGVYDAFKEAGCEHVVFDFMKMYVTSKNVRAIRNRFIEQCNKEKPDLLFLQIQHTTIIDQVSVQAVKKTNPNMKIINWTGDIRNNIPVTYKKIGLISDYNLISSTGQLDMFKGQLKNVDYLQIGYNPKLYYPLCEQKKSFQFDVTFIGHNNTKEKYPGASVRENACSILRQQFGSRFGLFGTGWPKALHSKGSLNQRNLITAYHNSVCNLSISHFNDVDHYFSDRLLMTLACGRPVISLRFPKWESYFTNNCDLIIVDSIEEIPDKVIMLKENPDLANFIGQQGAAKVRAEHTYLTMVKKLLHKVGLDG